MNGRKGPQMVSFGLTLFDILQSLNLNHRLSLHCRQLVRGLLGALQKQLWYSFDEGTLHDVGLVCLDQVWSKWRMAKDLWGDKGFDTARCFPAKIARHQKESISGEMLTANDRKASFVALFAVVGGKVKIAL